MSASHIYLCSSHLIVGNRLDELFFHCLGIQKYNDLSYVVKIILTLSHCQASVEREFSINRSLVKVNMKEETIVAKKIIRDYILQIH